MPGWELIGDEEKQAVLAMFDGAPHGQMLVNKHLIHEFEEAMAASLAVPFAIAVSSGTAALKVALKALGIGPGDEVITQAHTFVATVEAIVDCGATPVIAEIDETLNMDLLDMRRRVTRRTRAILPVHMLGAAVEMQWLVPWAREHGIAVIEDTAQACHGMYHGRALGTLGTVGALSFSYSKILTTGEGGMVVTHDPDMATRVRSYADHGHDNDPTVASRGQDTHARPGFNYRMSAFAAAIGLAQLKKLPDSLKRHRANYQALMAALGSLHFRYCVDESGDISDALVFFLDTEEQARKVARRLFEQDKIMLKNLPDALNWHFAGNWDHIGGLNTHLPKSASILRRAIAIQVMALWTESDIKRVAEAILQAIKEAA